MKILLDTNVLISSFITHGVCSELFEYCLTEHTICISEWIIDEFYEKLTKKFKFPKPKVEQVINFIRKNTLILKSIPLSSPVCRDSDDDNVLASALNGNVDCIISGDDDLLVLDSFHGIKIISPSNFWKFEKQK